MGLNTWFKGLLAAGMSLATLMGAGVAHADLPVLQASTYSQIDGDDLFDMTNNAGGFPTPYFSIVATLHPGVTSDYLNANPFINEYYNEQAVVSYFAQVNGPEGASALVDIVGNSTVNAPGAAAAMEYIDLMADPSTRIQHLNDGSFEGNDFVLPAGSLLEISLYGFFYGDAARLANAAHGSEGATFTVSADPRIFIDPNDPNASLFSVSVSPGAGNEAPPSDVPEPATWTLMALGVGVLGAALRAQRDRQTPTEPMAAFAAARSTLQRRLKLSVVKLTKINLYVWPRIVLLYLVGNKH